MQENQAFAIQFTQAATLICDNDDDTYLLCSYQYSLQFIHNIYWQKQGDEPKA